MRKLGIRVGVCIVALGCAGSAFAYDPCWGVPSYEVENCRRARVEELERKRESDRQFENYQNQVREETRQESNRASGSDLAVQQSEQMRQLIEQLNKRD